MLFDKQKQILEAFVRPILKILMYTVTKRSIARRKALIVLVRSGARTVSVFYSKGFRDGKLWKWFILEFHISVSSG